MTELLVRGARLADRDGPHDISADRGRIVRVAPANTDGDGGGAETVIEASGALVSPPYVEPHVHLDAALTAGQPRWNGSGTLWEGIEVWGERRAELGRADVLARAEEVLRWYAARGVLHVRSHVDVTDPGLTALDALLELRDRVRDVVGLQVVAFPQEGIRSGPAGAATRGRDLLAEAARRGADAVGAIPHFEDTREDGVASLEDAVALAERHDLMVDVHCDEIDDEQSRFAEVLAALARRTGLGGRVTASHTTAMGSYNGAYGYKLRRIIARSGMNLVCNPLTNLALQGRFDGYPKRRGLTQVAEMLDAGVNVAFGHDDVMDPWFPLGAADPLQIALTGIAAAQLTGQAQIAAAYDMITVRAARVLGLGDGYGIAEGRPADLLVLPAADPLDVIRRQPRPLWVVARGKIVASTPYAPTDLGWPGGGGPVDFVRPADAPSATWRAARVRP
ncbi:MAG TPA: cytosine deaminase [Streptosporangiaceae bacterium]